MTKHYILTICHCCSGKNIWLTFSQEIIMNHQTRLPLSGDVEGLIFLNFIFLLFVFEDISTMIFIVMTWFALYFFVCLGRGWLRSLVMRCAQYWGKHRTRAHSWHLHQSLHQGEQIECWRMYRIWCQWTWEHETASAISNSQKFKYKDLKY